MAMKDVFGDKVVAGLTNLFASNPSATSDDNMSYFEGLKRKHPYYKYSTEETPTPVDNRNYKGDNAKINALSNVNGSKETPDGLLDEQNKKDNTGGYTFTTEMRDKYLRIYGDAMKENNDMKNRLINMTIAELYKEIPISESTYNVLDESMEELDTRAMTSTMMASMAIVRGQPDAGKYLDKAYADANLTSVQRHSYSIDKAILRDPNSTEEQRVKSSRAIASKYKEYGLNSRIQATSGLLLNVAQGVGSGMFAIPEEAKRVLQLGLTPSKALYNNLKLSELTGLLTNVFNDKDAMDKIMTPEKRKELTKQVYNALIIKMNPNAVIENSGDKQ